MKLRVPLIPFFALALTCAAHGQTYTWTNATGGNWNTASNWDTTPDVPVFGADVVVDFSTLNITANRTLNLGSTGKIIGKIIFGDTVPGQQWDIVAMNGPLRFETTTGKPEIETVNTTSVITVQITGTQGFGKTGPGILRLNNTANPITGEILVSEGALQIRDGSVNNPTVFAAATMDDRSLRITGTGIVDLFRLGAGANAAVTWTLPGITLENGGMLRFRNNNGNTITHSLSAALTIGSGGGEIASTGADVNGIQNAILNGALSGSGALHYRAANGGTATRSLSVTSADNDFSGNWTVSRSSGTGTALLSADAANALGTGTVALNTRATLQTNASGGLDSLSGVTLNESTSTLDLANRSWHNPAASLTVNDGVVQVGGGLLSVGTITASGGEIRITAEGDSTAPVVTAGNADLGGSTLSVTLGGSPAGGPFELVRYGGSLVQPPAVVVSGDSGRLTATVDNGSGDDDSITLSFTGSVADLVWTGEHSNVWDNNGTANFLNGAEEDVFRSFDNVLFDDSSDVTTLSLPGVLNAGSVTFNHSSADYTLNGAGGIAGPAALVKSGGGTLTLNTPNTFHGPVTVNGGKLVLGNAAALGAAGEKTVTIQPGAQLDFNGTAPGTSRDHFYKIEGAGDGSGALVNSSATGINQNSGVLRLELLGDASVGGTGRFDIGRTGDPSGGIIGNGHKLTKTGSNSIFLHGPAEDVEILVAQGTLGVQDSGLALGGATGSVTVNGGASLLVQDGLEIATPLRLAGDSLLSTAGSGTADWSGPVTLAGNADLSLSGTSLVISAPVGEDGGSFELRKGGGNLLTLSGDNSHSGGTRILAGQVTASSDTAFGTGTVTAERDDSGGAALRVNLSDVTLDNDFVLNSNAPTVVRGVISTAAGNTLSVLNGDITLARFPSNGGTFSAFDGGTLRILGAIWSTNGINPNARSGIIEIGGGQGNYAVFAHGEGTLRLVSENGIVPTARLLSAINGASTFDLNGFSQTLAGLSRQTANTSTVTNSSIEPAVLTINSTTATTFGGIVSDGFGGVSIVKSGPESWTLTGNNTYTGTTTVSQGTLAIDGNQMGAIGELVVSDTATLAGSGSLGGQITANEGATLAPGGATTGTLTAVSPVHLQTGSKLRIGIDSGAAMSSNLFTYDLVALESGVALETDDIATSPAPLPIGTELVLIDYGSPGLLQGTFDGLPEGAPLTIGINGFTIQYDNDYRVTLTATGVEDPYLAWAANPAFGLTAGVNDGFTQDADGDGLANGLEWILGGNPSQQDAASLVTTTRPPAGGLTLTFTRDPDSISFADLAVEYDGDLAAPWTSVPIGAADSGPDANGVTVDIDDSGSPHQVTVTIPATNEQSGRLFSRLATSRK